MSVFGKPIDVVKVENYKIVVRKGAALFRAYVYDQDGNTIGWTPFRDREEDVIEKAIEITKIRKDLQS